MLPFRVIVLCPEISEALQRIAFKQGFTWRGEKIPHPIYTDKDYLLFEKDLCIYHGDLPVLEGSKETIVSIEEAIEKLQSLIKIDKNLVIKTKTGLQIGELNLTKEQVKKMYELCGQ